MLNIARKQEHLWELAKGDPSHRFKRLHRIVCDELWLTEAWQQIRNNSGSKTAGVDGQTKTQVEETLIKQLAAKLQQGEYRPRPVRRVYIPKSNGKKRPLGIPTIQDRIVQSALKMLLEPIFEADFSNSSHGFRREKSCISALRDAAMRAKRSTWWIEGDIEGCFDNIHHGRLMTLLRRRIRDEKLLSLIYSFLKAGYLARWSYHQTYSGTPQGGIISPLLANIYLNELDKFMESIGANRKETLKERNARINPEYRVIERRLNRMRSYYKTGKIPQGRGKLPLRFMGGHDDWVKEIAASEIRTLKKVQKTLTSNFPTEKIGYVRYADDFIVVLQKHSKAEAKELKEKIKEYLRTHLYLTLSDEKTLVSHPTDGANFLGYNLTSSKGKEKYMRLSIPKEAKQKVIREVQKKCKLHQIDDTDLFTQLNAVTRGWMHYYKYASYPYTVFNAITVTTFKRASHCLARKKQTSIPKVFVQYLMQVPKGTHKRKTLGRWVGKKLVYLDVFPPKRVPIITGPLPMDSIDRKRTITELNTNALETLEAENYQCQVCGINEDLQVHHTGGSRGYRHTKDRQQARRDKPVVVLCRKCHLQVGHQGSFNPTQRHKVNLAGKPDALKGARPVWEGAR